MRVRYFVVTIPVIAATLIFSGFHLARAGSVTVTATALTSCGDNVIQAGEQCDGADLNGTTCYALGYSGGTLACSSRCSFVTTQCTVPGGHGGGNNDVPFDLDDLEPSVIISGRAYPFATVVISEGSAVKASTIADSTARFQATIKTTDGIHSFRVYGLDRNGRRSPQQNFTTTVHPDVVNAVAGIFLAPTIGLDRSALKKGSVLGVSGLTVPQGVISLHIDSDGKSFLSIPVKSNGDYFAQIPMNTFAYGPHTLRAKVIDVDAAASGFSETLNFVIAADEQLGCGKQVGDLNCDEKVNLIDLSTLLYWWHTVSPQGLAIADLNQDGKVDLVDLSIMLSRWDRLK